ncbi:uncharacterized protein LOC133291809 [Gastrolobium bilobum]|uniref:uncharacterized protein LOC133291809 n=1 Tax=Gastrolobium bilobum TaxID=150636 RepID=UPI002AB09E15|nr:uncharacterized protein LOC133291809 [Gastrolobium bilobum]
MEKSTPTLKLRHQDRVASCHRRNNTTCDGLADFSTLHATCGRPLGLGFNHQTGELYVADAYFGLVKVCSNGGPPTQLAATQELLEGKQNSEILGQRADNKFIRIVLATCGKTK